MFYYYYFNVFTSMLRSNVRLTSHKR